MSEKKNIDRLFQEKFKDFEAIPSDKVWKGIEAKLKEEKDDRKVLPLWFKLAGIAAALLIGFLITNVFENPVNYPNNTIVVDGNETSADPAKDTDAESLDNSGNAFSSDVVDAGETDPVNIGTGKSIKSDIAGSDNDTKYESKSSEEKIQTQYSSSVVQKHNQKRNSTAQSQPLNADDILIPNSIQNKERNLAGSQPEHRDSQLTNSKDGISKSGEPIAELKVIPQSIENNNTQITDLSSDKKIDTAAIATVVPNTLEELLNEKEKTVTTNERNINRWQISSTVAPIYFSSTSNGSPIDPRFANNAKEYKPNLAFGLGVRYALNNKFTVRAGVNTIGMEYNTNDIVFSQNADNAKLQHVSTNIQGSQMQIESKGPATGLTELAVNNSPVKKFEASLNQKTGYIEVPVELAYKLVDKRFGVEIIGGVSTLFLNENEVSILASGAQLEIGKANNLNDTHFSTNLGIGLKYSFLKSLQFNVEPMFKYQINTFTDAGNFKPFFFGLYTGINYRF